jgi:Na+/phosphate symporter
MQQFEDYQSYGKIESNRMAENFANIQENLIDASQKQVEETPKMQPEQTNELKNMITNQQNNITAMMEKISDKDEELQNKMERSILQQREIEYKKKLIDTRNRMLQLSQDKNVYKSKVIYTLLASIIMITMVLLAIYIYFMRK